MNNYSNVEVRKNAVLEYAQNSTCRRRKVAAFVFDYDYCLMGQGYNKGVIELCDDNNCSTLYPCENTAHAECEAILDATWTGGECDSRLYSILITLFPCKNCAKLIILSGIQRVEYIEDYRDMSALKLFQKAGIEVVKI